jgi:hypothetical protein
MTERDLVGEVLAAAQPLLFARDYAAASVVVKDAADAAIAEGLTEQAATLSHILGTYLSLSGDQKAAGQAFEYACTLDSSPHHHLSAAEHQFFRLNERDAAKDRVARIRGEKVDDLTGYQAAVIAGRFALAECDTAAAVACLVRAAEVGQAVNLPSIWWNTSLAKKLMTVAPEALQYLRDLQQRARDQNDQRLVAEVSDILGESQTE